RHTRCLSDWSSDVCSSDLFFGVAKHKTLTRRFVGKGNRDFGVAAYCIADRRGIVDAVAVGRDLCYGQTDIRQKGTVRPDEPRTQIGRASCREREESRVEAG